MAASASSARGEEDPSLAPSEPRRLIPGPWTHQETINLIDAYREKWYSLNRGQLRTSHWDKVAESVRKRCGFSELSKTSIQCRHKMEKLRKRYRTEKQKGLSSWLLYKKMDAMENPSSETPKEDSDTTENGAAADPQNLFLLMSNGKTRSPPPVWAADPGDNLPRSFRSFSSSSAAKFFRLKHGNSEIGELTDAIRSLGDGFIKLERMKMELMREFERMRMEMEMQRTKMIIESQQQIAGVLAEALYTRKKLKRMASPES